MLVFGITDGVSTPEEVTPWEGELMAPVMKSSLSSSFEALDFCISESCSGGPILVFIRYKTED